MKMAELCTQVSLARELPQCSPAQLDPQFIFGCIFSHVEEVYFLIAIIGFIPDLRVIALHGGCFH